MAEVKIKEGSLEIEIVDDDGNTTASFSLREFKQKVTKVVFTPRDATEPDFVCDLPVSSK